MLVNTIHSSSLTLRPTAYPQADTTRVQDAQKKPSSTSVESNADALQAAAPSTPEQIRAALETMDASRRTNGTPITDLRTAKALATYLETRNQPMQAERSGLFSGINLYA